MAKKTKEPIEPNESEDIVLTETKVTKKAKEAPAKKSTSTKSDKSASSKKGTKKTEVEKKSTRKSSKENGSTSQAKKTSTKKASTATKAKKASTKKSTTTTRTKKASTKKSTTTTRTKKASTKKVAEFESEYYDLPYSYNKTIVKLLAQTPKTLFVYWEVSEEDRENFKKTYGENFFNVTKPVLIVHNDTLNYSFEVDINDFANSWYLHINDSKCNYRVELGRRPLPTANQHIAFQAEQSEEDSNVQLAYIPYYVYVTSSNNMIAPNNRILFNPKYKTILFRNVKTGQVIEKDMKEFTFITNLGIFNIQDLYKFLSKDEFEKFDLSNPTSGNPSSSSLSSRFN